MANANDDKFILSHAVENQIGVRCNHDAAQLAAARQLPAVGMLSQNLNNLVYSGLNASGSLGGMCGDIVQQEFQLKSGIESVADP